MFSQACVSPLLFTSGGGICDKKVVWRGHAWQGACVAGGNMHGGACLWRQVCLEGQVWQGACMVGGGVHGGGGCVA